jgi:two-component system sensor histidine kinase AtoS
MSDQDSVISEAHGTGFAVLCDPAGLVKAMLVQDGEPCSAVAVGRSLRDSVDEDSRLKLDRFLAAAQRATPALGWEMNLPYSAGLRALLFAAVREGSGLIVAAATGAHRLARLIDTLATTEAFAEGEASRALSRAVMEIRARAETDAGLFDGLSRLNNELAGLHRELAKSHTALERQREWLWTILASLDDAVIATGPDGKVIFMNRAAAILTGQELRSDGTVALEDFLHLVSEPVADSRPISLRTAWAEGGKVAIEGYFVPPSPRVPLPVSGMARPLLDQEGSPIGALVLLRDMTAAVRIQQVIVESERLGVAAGMAAGIAHTVNNVLQIISSNAEVLAPGIPPERRQQVENIRAGVNRISDLTGSLLILTDAGAGEAISMDLNEIVKHAVAQGGPFPPGVQVRVDLSPTLVRVSGVRARLHAALLGILANAREAIHSVGHITVSTVADGESAVVRIRDDGEGMTLEVQKRLFTPFVTTKLLGRGLGLATARATIVAHGGYLEIESAPGGGTTVTLTLPVVSEGQ